MALFLKPKPGEKPLIERFSGFTDRVKTAQTRLREQKKNRIREETRAIREEISHLKAQNRLNTLKENLSRRSDSQKRQRTSNSLFGNGGGFGF